MGLNRATLVHSDIECRGRIYQLSSNPVLLLWRAAAKAEASGSL